MVSEWATAMRAASPSELSSQDRSRSRGCDAKGKGKGKSKGKGKGGFELHNTPLSLTEDGKSALPGTHQVKGAPATAAGYTYAAFARALIILPTHVQRPRGKGNSDKRSLQHQRRLGPTLRPGQMKQQAGPLVNPAADTPSTLRALCLFAGAERKASTRGAAPELAASS